MKGDFERDVLRPAFAVGSETKSMLGSEKLVAFVASRDLSRSRVFYKDTLGLQLVSEDHYALVFDVAGTMLRVTAVQELSPAKHTVLGWRVREIVRAVVRLRRAGIGFQLYAGLQQNKAGIWTSPGGAKVAWFKDPDGNILSITQF